MSTWRRSRAVAARHDCSTRRIRPTPGSPRPDPVRQVGHDGHDRGIPGPLQFATSNADLVVKNNDPNDWETAPGERSAPELTVDLSDAGKTTATDALTASLQNCVKARDVQPAGCPQAVFDFEFVPNTATWKITSGLDSLNFNPGTNVRLKLDVYGEVDWAVTYRAKDFENRVTTQHDTTASFVHAVVDLSKSPPAVVLSS